MQAVEEAIRKEFIVECTFHKFGYLSNCSDGDGGSGSSVWIDMTQQVTCMYIHKQVYKLRLRSKGQSPAENDAALRALCGRVRARLLMAKPGFGAAAGDADWQPEHWQEVSEVRNRLHVAHIEARPAVVLTQIDTLRLCDAPFESLDYALKIHASSHQNNSAKFVLELFVDVDDGAGARQHIIYRSKPFVTRKKPVDSPGVKKRKRRESSAGSSSDSDSSRSDDIDAASSPSMSAHGDASSTPTAMMLASAASALLSQRAADVAAQPRRRGRPRKHLPPQNCAEQQQQPRAHSDSYALVGAADSATATAVPAAVDSYANIFGENVLLILDAAMQMDGNDSGEHEPPSKRQRI